jgi:hypothetical protein
MTVGRAIAAMVWLAAVSCWSTACATDDCPYEDRYRELDLTAFCAESGRCSFNGDVYVCPKAGADYCRIRCQHQSDPDGCFTQCVNAPDPECSYYRAEIGGDVSWEYPIALLGDARHGFTVLFVRIDAGAPLGDLEFRVEVGGETLCTASATNATPPYTAEIECPLPAETASVRFSVAGNHPAFGPSPKLREPSPRPVRICPL